MIKLPNGFLRSEFSIFPKNWEDKRGVDISRDWYFTYRFYDPAGTRSKLVMVKGMNYAKTLKDRQENTIHALMNEAQKLERGWNPFLNKYYLPRNQHVIDPHTPMIEALRASLSRLTIEKVTRRDIKNVINVCEKAAERCFLIHYEIAQLRRVHIRALLEECQSLMPNFSDNTYNRYRSYLNILFNELLEVEAVESNPVKDIKKKTVQAKKRETLSDEQRVKVNELLLKNHATFHRFLHIFFHSGARITELMKVRVKDVDLKNQRYECEILKGKTSRIVQRTIKDIALPLWAELIREIPDIPDERGVKMGEECSKNVVEKGDFYIFSRGLKPGSIQIQPYQITKRWYRLVKKQLGITATFYSLKHLHTSEVVDRLGDEAAAKMNEHTTTGMVVKIYDHRRKDREHEALKKLDNTFVK